MRCKEQKHIIFHISYIIVAPLCPAFLKQWFLQSSLFWKAHCAPIGQLSSALWLAEYLKRVMEMLRPSPYLETHRVSSTTILQWE